ncbi:MAG: tRNA (adenosine(37)-N6)-threonylcarbamoyltransferase complex transferase subunit TsaD [Candidatus Hydrogenedentes bacterium]|nr:tRNA (adenosine(37)-N6)-threonylcarbamoyltransferase complex transferase subunit TsaD [Candidatus Hydrogenedentota bacterium]
MVLGIESSCDETGIAIVRNGVEVIANEVASQIDIHREFGGVVPEIASRQHTTIISQLTEKVLAEAGIRIKDIDGIAATQGPGLMGALLVGLCFGKALAYAWKKPFVPVHHIEGHLFSVFLGEARPEFPLLALVVSGGHTQLIHWEAPHQYTILGATRDDAVGESFDKVARLLNLPYPGGPSIQRAAEGGNPEAFDFPRAMMGRNTLDFSYSGLKTAVLYALQAGDLCVADVAASFQHAAVDALVRKTQQALDQTGLSRLALAGGVAANRLLRDRLMAECNATVYLPPFKYCIDNGAMIAAAACSRLDLGLTGDLSTVANPNLPFTSLA